MINNPKLQARLEQLGYTEPTPVQELAIPLLVDGKDVVVQAQTGTGKTAAFALPIINAIEPKSKNTQALVLAPTRELAIQVSEKFAEYGLLMKVSATAIYGGQSYTVQEKALRKNASIIVATPGRLVDMLKSRKINLSKVRTVILDEADEMLKMGFLDDVEWILEQMPESRQTGLFSATMPKKVRDMAKKYLNKPEHITIKPNTEEVAKINQKLVSIKQREKLDVLTRLLSAQGRIGIIIFVRTKNESMELAEKLQKRGHEAAPINGDMNQAARERAIDKLKTGKLDILVATDVAARGIDVDRIECVINYDIPFDLDSYVHRIGRTGRGGRTGNAILFATPRERGLLRDIERKYGNLEEIIPPSHDDLNKLQLEKLGQNAINVVKKSKRLQAFTDWSNELLEGSDVAAHEIIAALGYLALQDVLFDKPKPEKPVEKAKRPDKGRFKGKSDRDKFKDKKSFKKKNKKYS